MPTHTTKTLELRLRRLPKKARQAFLVADIPHNLVAVATLVDAGCSVHMYYWGFEIEYNGEVIYKGWREGKSNLFQMRLEDDGVNNIVPDIHHSEYDLTDSLVTETINWSVNSIYECDNKQQWIKYYHANLGSHLK